MIRSRVPANYTIYPYWGTDRESAQQLLYEQAAKVGAKITFGVTVADVEDTAEEASLTLDTGATMQADLVLVADGVTSHLRSQVLRSLSVPPKPAVSNTTFYQITVAGRDLLADARAKTLAGSLELNLWLGEGSYVVGHWNSKVQRYWAVFGVLDSSVKSESLWDAVSVHPLLDSLIGGRP